MVDVCLDKVAYGNHLCTLDVHHSLNRARTSGAHTYKTDADTL
jgi:hypothetical protein